MTRNDIKDIADYQDSKIKNYIDENNLKIDNDTLKVNSNDKVYAIDSHIENTITLIKDLSVGDVCYSFKFPPFYYNPEYESNTYYTYLFDDIYPGTDEYVALQFNLPYNGYFYIYLGHQILGNKGNINVTHTLYNNTNGSWVDCPPDYPCFTSDTSHGILNLIKPTAIKEIYNENSNFDLNKLWAMNFEMIKTIDDKGIISPVGPDYKVNNAIIDINDSTWKDDIINIQTNIINNLVPGTKMNTITFPDEDLYFDYAVNGVPAIYLIVIDDVMNDGQDYYPALGMFCIGENSSTRLSSFKVYDYDNPVNNNQQWRSYWGFTDGWNPQSLGDNIFDYNYNDKTLTYMGPAGANATFKGYLSFNWDDSFPYYGEPNVVMNHFMMDIPEDVEVPQKGLVSPNGDGINIEDSVPSVLCNEPDVFINNDNKVSIDIKTQLQAAISTDEEFDYSDSEITNVSNSDNLPSFWGNTLTTPLFKVNNKLYFGGVSSGTTPDVYKIGIANLNNGNFSLVDGESSAPGPGGNTGYVYKFNNFLFLGCTASSPYINCINLDNDTFENINTGTSRIYLNTISLANIKEIRGIDNTIMEKFGFNYTYNNIMVGTATTGVFTIEVDDGDLVFNWVTPSLTTTGKWSFIAYTVDNYVYLYSLTININYIMKLNIEDRTTEFITIENAPNTIPWGNITPGMAPDKNIILGDYVPLRSYSLNVTGMGWLDIFNDVAEFIPYPSFNGVTYILGASNNAVFVQVGGVGIVACTLVDGNIQYNIIYSSSSTNLPCVFHIDNDYLYYYNKTVVGIRKIDFSNNTVSVIPGTENLNINTYGTWLNYIDFQDNKYYLSGNKCLIIIDITDDSVTVVNVNSPAYIGGTIYYINKSNKYILITPSNGVYFLYDKINNVEIDISKLPSGMTPYQVIGVIEDIILYKNTQGVLGTYHVVTGTTTNFSIADTAGNIYYRSWNANLYDDNNVYNVLFEYGALNATTTYKIDTVSFIVLDHDKKVILLKVYDEILLTIPLGGS